MERRLFLSIVIPVFKSKAILPVFFNTLILELKEINFLLKTEIILVDDCSNDGSWEEIQKLAKNYKHIKGLKLKKMMNLESENIKYLLLQTNMMRLTIEIMWLKTLKMY